MEELQQRVARSECLYNAAVWRIEALEFMLLNGRNHVQAVNAKEENEHEGPSVKRCTDVAAKIVETLARERQRDEKRARAEGYCGRGSSRTGSRRAVGARGRAEVARESAEKAAREEVARESAEQAAR